MGEVGVADSGSKAVQYVQAIETRKGGNKGKGMSWGTPWRHEDVRFHVRVPMGACLRIQKAAALRGGMADVSMHLSAVIASCESSKGTIGSE